MRVGGERPEGGEQRETKGDDMRRRVGFGWCCMDASRCHFQVITHTDQCFDIHNALLTLANNSLRSGFLWRKK